MTAATATTTVFECRNTTVDLQGEDGAVRILDEVSLRIAEGQFVTVIGHSGTGKTTLLRALGGLQSVASGPDSLNYKGGPVDGPPLGSSFIFQDYVSSLLPWRTVSKNVALGVEGRLPKAEIVTRVDEALEMVGLRGRGSLYPDQLSGGMQQRVQIARALVTSPSVLLMDEPFGALDAMTRSQLQDELQRLHQTSGLTIVFVTHDTDEAVYLSDRIIVLEGSPASVTADVPVPLPRPRTRLETREMPEFLRLRRRVQMAVQGE